MNTLRRANEGSDSLTEHRGAGPAAQAVLSGPSLSSRHQVANGPVATRPGGEIIGGWPWRVALP